MGTVQEQQVNYSYFHLEECLFEALSTLVYGAMNEKIIGLKINLDFFIIRWRMWWWKLHCRWWLHKLHNRRRLLVHSGYTKCVLFSMWEWNHECWRGILILFCFMVLRNQTKSYNMLLTIYLFCVIISQRNVMMETQSKVMAAQIVELNLDTVRLLVWFKLFFLNLILLMYYFYPFVLCFLPLACTVANPSVCTS